MEITILGCGTSTGVPIVGCDCPVCTSPHPRNKRLRASAAVRLDNGKTILIDTSPDLRQQALADDLRQVDAVFYTHLHADHTHGIDELRTYNYLQRRPMDIYAAGEHIAGLQSKFTYIFEESLQQGGGKPSLIMHEIVPGESFSLFSTRVVPIPLWHGQLLSVGWRIGDFAYLSDVNRIPDESLTLLTNLDVLILGALRWTEHTTHFSIDEAVREASRIGAKRTFLTHMGHEVDYDEVIGKVGQAAKPAYDGLRLKIG